MSVDATKEKLHRQGVLGDNSSSWFKKLIIYKKIGRMCG
jgi:hypothetical protein